MMLTTNRLNIRPLKWTDLEAVHALHCLPETDAFNTLGIPENLQTTEKILGEWLAAQQLNPRTSYVFSIELLDSKQFIGLIAINLGKPKYRIAEVWYKMHKDHWNQGYATEALLKLLDFGFNELKLHRIEAGCAVENIASCKVLEKAGMTREGRKRKILPIRGEWGDNYSYAILEADFFKTNSTQTSSSPSNLPDN